MDGKYENTMEISQGLPHLRGLGAGPSTRQLQQFHRANMQKVGNMLVYILCKLKKMAKIFLVAQVLAFPETCFIEKFSSPSHPPW